MTEPVPTRADKGKPNPSKKAQPQLSQALVSIDTRNLAAAQPSPKLVEQLIDRIASELRRCGDEQNGGYGRAARMVARPVPGAGTGGGGGGGGGDTDNDLIEGCIVTAVVYEQVVQNGEVRLVRVEHYTCPNGHTYTRRSS
jgi:hypothetical protein